MSSDDIRCLATKKSSCLLGKLTPNNSNVLCCWTLVVSCSTWQSLEHVTTCDASPSLQTASSFMPWCRCIQYSSCQQRNGFNMLQPLLGIVPAMVLLHCSPGTAGWVWIPTCVLVFKPVQEKRPAIRSNSPLEVPPTIPKMIISSYFSPGKPTFWINNFGTDPQGYPWNGGFTWRIWSFLFGGRALRAAGCETSRPTGAWDPKVQRWVTRPGPNKKIGQCLEISIEIIRAMPSSRSHSWWALLVC